MPAQEGFYSCVFVGFENNGAEGGMNSTGLPFDGAHYYDIPKIRAQLTEALKPPLSNMRSFLREYTASTNRNQEATARVSSVTRRLAGKMRRDWFSLSREERPPDS